MTMFCKKKGNALLLALDANDVKNMYKMIQSANLPESQHFFELKKIIEDKFPEVK